MSTDEFFEQNLDTFDIIFIDADHSHNQVWKDFWNSIAVLNDNGTIVMHDGNPKDARHENPGKCSTAWRAIVKLREHSDLDMIVCDFDHGTTCVRRGKNTRRLVIDKTMDELVYPDLARHRKEWLDPQASCNVINWMKAKI